MIIDVTRDYNSELFDEWKHTVKKYRITQSHAIDYNYFPDAPYWGDGKNISTIAGEYEDGDFYQWIENLLSTDDEIKIKEYKDKINDIQKSLFDNGWYLHSTVPINNHIEAINILYINRLDVSHVMIIDDCYSFDDTYLRIYFKKDTPESKIFDNYLRRTYLSHYIHKEFYNKMLNDGWIPISCLTKQKEIKNCTAMTTRFYTKLSVDNWLINNCSDLWFRFMDLIVFKSKKDAMIYILRWKGEI